MFITEDQLDERLRSPKNLANRFKNGVQTDVQERLSTYSENSLVKTEDQERPQEIQFKEIKRPGNNRPWLSSQVRTRIATDVAESALTKVTQTEIARTYDVEVSTVSDIANGVRRVPDSPRSADQRKVDLALDNVRDIAINRLTSSLGQLTDDKISAHNARDISAICANMAKVVQQTIPQEKTAQQINLVVYAPELKAEKNYDVVEI